MADTDTMADVTPKFSFQLLQGKRFASLESKDNQEYLLKWSMKDRICAQTFTFDQPFQAYQKDDFITSFMQDPAVISQLKVVSSSGSWSNLGVKSTSAKAEPVACSVLSMSYFDRLEENGIVRESGHIAKCFDEYYGDFVISDELRKCLLDEDSDHYDTFSDAERNEFLFRLFQHFCLGGTVCQYEDDLQPYLDITKAVYKDLVSVQKDSSSGELHVASVVFSISATDNSGKFYPSDRQNIQDFAYMVVNPLKRHATVLYHKFGSSVFT